MSDLILIDLYTEDLNNEGLTGRIIRERMAETRRNCDRMQDETAGVTSAAAATSGDRRMYHELIDEPEDMCDTKGKLWSKSQWEIMFANDEGDIILMGDDPWQALEREEEENMGKMVILNGHMFGSWVLERDRRKQGQNGTPCELELMLVMVAGSGTTGGSWWLSLAALTTTEHLQSGHVKLEWSQFRMQSPWNMCWHDDYNRERPHSAIVELEHDAWYSQTLKYHLKAIRHTWFFKTCETKVIERDMRNTPNSTYNWELESIDGRNVYEIAKLSNNTSSYFWVRDSRSSSDMSGLKTAIVSYCLKPGGHWGSSFSSIAVATDPDELLRSSSPPNPPSKNVPEKSRICSWGKGLGFVEEEMSLPSLFRLNESRSEPTKREELRSLFFFSRGPTNMLCHIVIILKTVIWMCTVGAVQFPFVSDGGVVGNLHLYFLEDATELARTELDVRLGLISDCPDRVRHQRLLPNTSDSGPSPTSKAKK
ncbi:hypothetical protein LXL04_005736 [Taraxacum kok-saghyz]